VHNDLSRVVDALPGLVWTALPDGDIDYVNQSWCDYTGIGAEESRGRGWQSAVHTDDLALLLERWPSGVARGLRGDTDARLRRFDGEYRWFVFRASPITDSADQIIGWCGVSSDIEDRRRTEKDLRAIETNFSGWVQSFPGLMVTMSMTGRVEMFSRDVVEYFGKTPQELRDWTMTDAVHPDDIARVVAASADSITTGNAYCIEHRCRRHDGVYRWFQVRALAVRDDHEQITGWFVVLVDIDDVKRAEEHLRQSEAFLLEVQRLSHTGGWRFDVANNTVESSPEIQRAYAPEPGEDISKPPFWFDRIHPEDRPRVQAEFDRCVRENVQYQAGYRIVLPAGNIRYQYATGHPILNGAGELLEFIGASMDMTEYWQATNELERASGALRELQATMSRAAHVATIAELAASIAHEVNQPLSGIITNASTCLRMLAADPPNVEGARETAKRTIRDGNRASDVITRLRTLFGKKEFALEPLDLNEATREVIALSLTEFPSDRLVVQADLADDLPLADGDRVQLQQVILNLIRNAADAMGGVDDRPQRVTIRTSLDEGNCVRLSVQDVGVGLDAENVDKVFVPFYTTKSDGMGIGLSVSRSIIESHRGRLWAAKNDGPGATFSFSIPQSFESPASDTKVSLSNQRPETHSQTAPDVTEGLYG
jgi:PAS domain S-box-containing protein